MKTAPSASTGLPGHRRRLRPLWWVGGFVLASGIAGVAVYITLTWDLPSLESLKRFRPPVSTEVFAADDTKLGEFFRERRLYLPLRNFPPMLVKAFVAAEDARFFHHTGISLTGILRAAVRNVQAGGIRQGGSTITQQVAKALLLTPERSFTRKISEAILAYRMERFLTKEQILEIYLNQVYLGQGSYGVQAAAQTFFERDVSDLTLGQMAMLAGLTRAPSRDNPFSDAARAEARRLYVLQRMSDERFLSSEDAAGAAAEDLLLRSSQRGFSKAPFLVEHVRRHLIEKYGESAALEGGLNVFTTVTAVEAEAAERALRSGLERIDRNQGYRGPLRHVSQADRPSILRELRAEAASSHLGPSDMRRGLVIGVDDAAGLVQVDLGTRSGVIPFETMRWARAPNPEKYWQDDLLARPSDALRAGDVILVRHSATPPPSGVSIAADTTVLELAQEPEVQGALVALDPRDGAVRAMVGGYDFARSEFNRTVQARRQPGSAFKPVTYAAAIDHGYTAASMLVDAPVVYDDPTTDRVWKPRNYGGDFAGETIFRVCLIESMNVPTVKIVEDIGVATVIDYARRMGITSPLSADFSLALGSSAISPIELATVYASFASGGRRVTPVYISRVVDRDGRVLERNLSDDPLLGPMDQVRRILKKDEERLAHAEAVAAQLNGETLPQGYAISPQTAYLMTHLLKQVVQEGTGRRASAIARPAAGKTGTTNDNLDAWFVGFTPTLVAAVWVGFDEARPLGVGEQGGRTATPIWLDFMKEALADTPALDFPVPEGVVFAQIDPRTGRLASEHTKNPTIEAFIEGTAPTETSDDARAQKSAADFFMRE